MFEWERYFEPHILERGWKYARAEAVQHLENTESISRRSLPQRLREKIQEMLREKKVIHVKVSVRMPLRIAEE